MKTAETKKKLYHIPEIDAAKGCGYGLKDIHQRKIDGIVLRQVLSPCETENIISNLGLLNESMKFEIEGQGGFSYPLSFNRLRADDEFEYYFERYFREAAQFRNHIRSMFKLDIEQKLMNVFSSLNGGRQVKVMEGITQGTWMSPVCLRVLAPGRGGVVPHCHNSYERELHPMLAKHISDRVMIKNLFSFYIMIDRPEAGGELALFDIEQDEAEGKVDQYNILRKDGRVMNTLNGELKKMLIALDSGDMVIFAGGDIWHRVEDIRGSKSRVTMGGFGSFAKDGSAFYYWA